MDLTKIAMIGTGYVGLVPRVCSSGFGDQVIRVDRPEGKIERINNDELLIHEPRFNVVLARKFEAGRLSFITNLAGAVDGANAAFFAVGTPTRRGDGHSDLTNVMASAEEVAPSLTDYAEIVTKSTAPLGSKAQVTFVGDAGNTQAAFDVGSNSEILREGAAFEDFR